MTLPDKHARFVAEYLIDMNAKEAAIRAGYSEKAARQQGCRLLAMPEVAEAVAAGQRRKQAKLEITADRVLRELALIAFADLGDCTQVNAAGDVQVLPLDSMRPEARRAIGELTQTVTESRVDGERVVEKVRTTIKHHSKVQALQMLVKHLGLEAPTKHEHQVEQRIPREQALAELRELAKTDPVVAKALAATAE